MAAARLVVKIVCSEIESQARVLDMFPKRLINITAELLQRGLQPLDFSPKNLIHSHPRIHLCGFREKVCKYLGLILVGLTHGAKQCSAECVDLNVSHDKP